MSMSECIHCGGFIPIGPNETNCCTRCGFHIFGEQPDWEARAEKAEAEVERLTKEMHDLKVSMGIRAVASEAMYSLARVATGIENNEITKLKAEVERMRALCERQLGGIRVYLNACNSMDPEAIDMAIENLQKIDAAGRGEGKA